ncbi:MAG: hypothetical protein RL338_652 [Chloroflexota bacterium]
MTDGGPRSARSGPAIGATIGEMDRLAARATLASLGVATLVFVFATILASSAGLVAVALFGGWLAGVLVRGAAGSDRDRRPIAAGAAAAGIIAGLVATWVAAGLLGGSLGLVDFLAETLGLLVPLQVALAAAAAWVAGRVPR